LATCPRETKTPLTTHTEGDPAGIGNASSFATFMGRPLNHPPTIRTHLPSSTQNSYTFVTLVIHPCLIDGVILVVVPVDLTYGRCLTHFMWNDSITVKDACTIKETQLLYFLISNRCTFFSSCFCISSLYVVIYFL
jgi:hypothetical protein